MNFDFTDDQYLLRDEIRKFLVNESPVALARTVIEAQGTYEGRAASVWRGLAEMGVTSLMLPEAFGGHGLGALELCLAAEEVGRQLAPVPLVSSHYLALQACLIEASQAQQARWLPRWAEGQVATLAAPLDLTSEASLDGVTLPDFDGRKLTGAAPLVPDGSAASFAVVLARYPCGKPVLVAVELGERVQRRHLATLDPSRPFAALHFDAERGEALDAHGDGANALPTLARVRDRAAVLTAFEQLGGADAALEMATGYARERRAFGRAIGSYQGIKHKLADIYTGNQMARAHCYYGAWALVSDAPELPMAAAGARVSATQAFNYAAQENIQTHGGMGYTWELDCHLYYRRARHLAVMLGSVHQWREQLAAGLEHQLAA